MATPTTAAQIERMQELFNRNLDGFRQQMDAFVWSSSRRILDMVGQRSVYLQRPHTDDMMQMLDDVGIDAPEFQPVSFDGKTFHFRRQKEFLPVMTSTFSFRGS